ncbi:MAG TPA: Glu/Leu/Phe/Val dehydrogenase dimerization domain-containing protein [Solirubrobacteraceae bacterium]|nr:Glu/Leu/Phe/Val dehydrogenase dimerization domain-containing protein [Solirubrobacteraceae bacterium]
MLRRGSRSGLYTIVAVHSTLRGPSLGGCRMWEYDDSRAALRDALRLSRAMTYKAAVADLTLGGGKGVIMLPPGVRVNARRRRDALLDFADTVEELRGTYTTAEDVGTSSRDMSLIAERTGHVAGLARGRGGSGDPSPFTAHGVEIAIRSCCARIFGSDSLADRRICVAGLGHVGSRVARRCARAGARLTVSDVDGRKRALARELGAEWIEPDTPLTAQVDVLAPCALGGILNEDTIPRLRCRIVAGAANNQLADYKLANLLDAQGILWAPDFVVNAGGLINCAAERGGYSAARARAGVRAIGTTLERIFDDAQAIGASPLTAAMELARRRLTRA